MSSRLPVVGKGIRVKRSLLPSDRLILRKGEVSLSFLTAAIPCTEGDPCLTGATQGIHDGGVEKQHMRRGCAAWLGRRSRLASNRTG